MATKHLRLILINYMVKLELKKNSKFPCKLEVFRVNGIDTDVSNFGYTKKSPVGNNELLCNREFVRELPSEELLSYLKITLSEYKQICDELEKQLQLRNCKVCKELFWDK